MTTSVVTGGAGFLGSHLCEHLLERGQRVICIDNLDTGTLENLEHINDENFVFWNHDITEFVGIDEPVDFIYHLASPASPIDYARLPLHTLKVGSYGTHHMLGVAKFKRARILVASTSEVYGDPEIHPQPEDYWGNVNPIGPRGVYDEAKRYAEALTMAYHRQQGVNTCISRTFNSYGSRMRAHDGRAVPTFLRQALQDKPRHRLRGRQPDPELLLRPRPDRRARRPGGVRRPPAGQHREPGRVHAAPARRDGDRGGGLALRDHLRAAAGRRPEDPPARHLPRQGPAGLGTEGPAPGGPEADDRRGRRRAPRRPARLAQSQDARQLRPDQGCRRAVPGLIGMESPADVLLHGE